MKMLLETHYTFYHHTLQRWKW